MLNRLIEVRAKEIIRTLRWAYSPSDKWKATFAIALRHTQEIQGNKHSKAKQRFGIEIELDFKESIDCRNMGIIIRNLLRCTYGDGAYSVQHDDSLKNGVEIVTAPMSYRKAYILGDILDDDLVRHSIDEKLEVGLHITVDPQPTEEQEYLFFAYFNDDKRVDELKALIGRPTNDYCKVRSVKGSRVRAIKDHNYAVHKRPNGALEVRLFKSPINSLEYHRRLEFIKFVDTQVREKRSKTVDELHQKVMEKFHLWLT